MAGAQGSLVLWRRWALVSSAALFALLLGLGVAALQSRGARPLGHGDGGAASGAGEREALQARLVADGTGLYDLAADGAVLRLLQPGLVERDGGGVPVSSNRFGLRERDYLLPKPAGTLRVVLLGDSFVFGTSLPAEERLGVELEGLLRRGLPEFPGAIECLHLAIPSWNLLAEVAFLRRQLDLLVPDLVIHCSVANDLDDVAGVRGFGAMAHWTVGDPAQQGTLVHLQGPTRDLDWPDGSLLPMGLEWESERRFAAASAAVADLSAAVEARGGRYLHLLHWMQYNPVAAPRLAAGLRAEQVAVLPQAFSTDRAHWVTPTDLHWGALGHRRVAAALYRWIADHGLLAPLQPTAAPRGATELDWFALGAAEARGEPSYDLFFAQRPLAAELRGGDLPPPSAQQVLAGLDRRGVVGPYLSLALPPVGRELIVEGRGLGRSELATLELRLELEGVELRRLHLAPQEPFAVTLELPAALAGRRLFNLRVLATDYVYAGDDLRELQSWHLVRAAVR
jgi:hypothetical protein